MRYRAIARIGPALLALAVSAWPAHALDVVLDDFSAPGLQGWDMGAYVWRDGRGQRIEQRPFKLERVDGPALVYHYDAGLRVEFASGKAEQHPNCYALLTRRPLPAPAAETRSLVFWIYKEAGSGRIKTVNLFNSRTWHSYGSGPIPLDFEGWHQVILRRDELRCSSAEMTWEDINYMQFVLQGDFSIVMSGFHWSADPQPDAPQGRGATREIPFEDLTRGGADARAGEALRVFSRNALERCSHLTVPEPGERLETLSVFASPGEYEPVTFSVRSAAALAGVEVRLTGDLRSQAGAIPSSAVDIRVVSSMSLWLDTRHMRSLEYLLVKRPAVDLAAGRTTRFWTTVKVPDDAKPGTYAGAIELQRGESVLVTIPYEVEVLPIELAALDEMTFFMYFRPSHVPDWGRNKAYLKTCFVDMREHGMNAISAYVYPDGSPFMETTRQDGPISMRETLAAIEETGLLKSGSGRFIWIAAACYGGGVLEMFTEAVRARGYEMVFYAIDEPGSERRNEQVRACVPRLRKACPDVPVTTAIGTKGIELVGDYYDTWICAMVAIDDARVAEAVAKGKTLWSYDCALAPTDALTARHYFGYLLWRTGAKGAAFWAYSDGSARDRFGLSIKEWTEFDERWTARHDFVWCTPDGPIPSVGWEATREGIDDYRYLRTLELTAKQARKQGQTKAAEMAEAFLAELRERIHPENYAKAATEARERARQAGRSTSVFERGVPEPSLSLTDYGAVRRRAADHILALQSVLGRAGEE